MIPILASIFIAGEGLESRDEQDHKKNVLYDPAIVNTSPNALFVKVQETWFCNAVIAGNLNSRLSTYNAELGFWHLSVAMKNTGPDRFQERVSVDSKGRTQVHPQS